MRKIIFGVLALISTCASLANELEQAVKQASASRMTVMTTASGWRYRLVYVGQEGSCSAVGSINLDAKRVQNFRICGDQVQERTEMVPSFPDDKEGDFVVEQTRRAAILYGQMSQLWQGYRIDARRVGLTGNTRCSPVETTVSYDNDLVFNGIKEICQ